MRLKLFEIEPIWDALVLKAFLGTPHLETSPGQLVRFKDIATHDSERGESIILTNPHPKNNLYPLRPTISVLADIVIQNKNIRPFTNYNKEMNDFILDFDAIYHCAFKEFQMDGWVEQKKALIDSEQLQTKMRDFISIDFLDHALNMNLRQLCQTPQGAVTAYEWLKMHPTENIKMPAALFQRIAKMPRLSIKDHEMILEKMYRNRHLKGYKKRER